MRQTHRPEPLLTNNKANRNEGRAHTDRPLRRLIGASTATCVGIGVAIGSGILRTPGDVARQIPSPWLILLLWLAVGGVTLMQSLVTAELATRLPGAGGEYQYLKSAYGNFAAFFFGWSFTVFILGAGTGVIAAAAGDFAGELLQLGDPWPRIIACVFILSITAVNAAGLSVGAGVQNVLTFLKLTALAAVVVGAFWAGRRFWPISPPPSPAAGPMTTFGWVNAGLAVFWSFSGANEPAKLAEEIRDVRRGLPRALAGATIILTLTYVLYNYAILCVLSPADLAGQPSAAAAIFRSAGRPWAGTVSLAISIVICLGCISSTLLSDVRVPFALARDGFAPAALARMSPRQSPTAALVMAGVIGAAFSLMRTFDAMLRIYFIASTVLFGMTYASLIVLRRRERHAGPRRRDVLRIPGGLVMAGLLVLIELGIALHLVTDDIRNGGRDTLWTLAMLSAFGVAYLLWRAARR